MISFNLNSLKFYSSISQNNNNYNFFENIYKELQIDKIIIPENYSIIPEQDQITDVVQYTVNNQRYLFVLLSQLTTLPQLKILFEIMNKKIQDQRKFFSEKGLFENHNMYNCLTISIITDEVIRKILLDGSNNLCNAQKIIFQNNDNDSSIAYHYLIKGYFEYPFVINNTIINFFSNIISIESFLIRNKKIETKVFIYEFLKTYFQEDIKKINQSQKEINKNEFPFYKYYDKYNQRQHTTLTQEEKSEKEENFRNIVLQLSSSIFHFNENHNLSTVFDRSIKGVEEILIVLFNVNSDTQTDLMIKEEDLQFLITLQNTSTNFHDFLQDTTEEIVRNHISTNEEIDSSFKNIKEIITKYRDELKKEPIEQNDLSSLLTKVCKYLASFVSIKINLYKSIIYQITYDKSKQRVNFFQSVKNFLQNFMYKITDTKLDIHNYLKNYFLKLIDKTHVHKWNDNCQEQLHKSKFFRDLLEEFIIFCDDQEETIMKIAKEKQIVFVDNRLKVTEVKSSNQSLTKQFAPLNLNKQFTKEEKFFPFKDEKSFNKYQKQYLEKPNKEVLGGKSKKTNRQFAMILFFLSIFIGGSVALLVKYPNILQTFHNSKPMIKKHNESDLDDEWEEQQNTPIFQEQTKPKRIT